MAVPLSNSAEGGSNGTTVTTGNSGGTSGDAWNVVSAGTGLTYTTATKMHGSVGYAFAAPANVIEQLSWTTSMGTQTDIYGRFYMFRSATPLEQQRIVRWADSVGTEGGRISWHTDGRVYSFDSTLAVPAGSTFTITANQWIRFEFHIFTNASTGIVEVKAFVGDSTTAIGTYTRTGLNTLTNVADIRFGNTIAATPGAFTMDDITVNATGYPGPAGAGTTAPSAPQTLIATPGNAQVALGWTAPASNGGSAVTGYLIYRGLGSGTETLLASPAGTGVAYTDSTAANGTTYFYEVSAVNAIGESALSNEVSATPSAGTTAPSAPLALQAVGGNTQVTLTWSAPASNGGSAVTAYKIYRGLTPGSETLLASPAGTGGSYTDLAVTNGTSYYYKVSAVNAIGESALSSEASATPALPSSTRTLKRLYGPAQLTASASTLYTCPASTTAVIRHIHVSNSTGASVDFSLSIGTSAVATRLWDGIPIAARDVLDHFQDHVLVDGEIIQGFASAVSSLNLTIDGYELSAPPVPPPAPIYPSDTLFPSNTSP